MMNKVSDQEIKRRELEILKFIDSFCRKNDITYFLAYGTLIGAIRHNGFIPWDDDIDIVMKREDYEKFKELFIDESLQYKMLNIDTNKEYYYPFIKIVDTETRVSEIDFKKIPDLGVCVDIFPLDNYSPKLMKFNSIELNKRKHLLARSTKFIKTKSTFKNIIKFFSFLLYKNKNPRKYAINLEQMGRRSKNKSDLLCVLFPPKIRKNLFRTQWYDEVIEHKFEDGMFYIPKNYDQILTSYYGNYMEYPPIEQRNSGHNIDVYFNTDE